MEFVTQAAVLIRKNFLTVGTVNTQGLGVGWGLAPLAGTVGHEGSAGEKKAHLCFLHPEH